MVLLNLIFRQYYVRLDFSGDNRHSLGSRSRAVVEALEQEHKFIYFGSKESTAFRRAGERRRRGGARET